MPKPFLIRHHQYVVKGVNYNRFLDYVGDGTYSGGVLRIEPYQDVKIYVLSFPTDTEAFVQVEKFDTTGKLISESKGKLIKTEVIKLLGLD